VLTEKRYLIYTLCNGQVHASIEYGDLTTGENKIKRDPNEIQRFEIKHDINDFKILKELYPRTILLEGDELPDEHI
jgi:hypothetical protein